MIIAGLIERKINNIQYNLIWCFILIVLAARNVCSHEQIIKMMPYRQEDSETNCTHGLISDVDTVGFKAEVDLSGDIHMRYVYFQRQSNSDSEFLFFKGISINESVADKNNWEIIRPHVAQFTITDKAKAENSGARIRGVLVTSDYKEIVSEQQTYPEIKESNDVNIRLLINGVEKQIQNSIYDIYAKGADIVIIYECHSQALPCLMEMSATDLMTPLLSKGYVLHISNLTELNITIKYASCTLNGKFNIINCHIKREVNLENKSTQEESTTFTVQTQYYTIISILILIIIGLLIKVLWTSKRLKFLRACPQHMKVPSFLKPKKDNSNSFEGQSTIQGMNEESCTYCNNAVIGHRQPQLSSSPLSDTHVDVEMYEREDTQPLIGNAGEKDEQINDRIIPTKEGLTCQDGQDNNTLSPTEDLACHEDVEELGIARLMPTKNVPSEDADNECHNVKGPISKTTMECGNEDDEKDKDNILTEDQPAEKRETGQLKLSKDKTHDSCGSMQEEAWKTNETVPQMKEFITTSEDRGDDNILSAAINLKDVRIPNKDRCETIKEEPSKTNDLRPIINQDYLSSVAGNPTVIGRIKKQKTREEVMQTLQFHVK